VSVTEQGVTPPPPPDPLEQISNEVQSVITRPRVYGQHQWLWWLVVAVLAGLVPLVVRSAYGYNLLQNATLYSLLALGFYLQFALAGQFSFATPAFYAVGAYSFVWAQGHWGFLAALIFAMIITGLLGGAVKLLLVRSPLIHFAIATLAVSSLIFVLFERVLTNLTGGDQGKFGIPTPSIFGYSFDTQERQYYLGAVLVMIVVAALIAFERSPGQRDLVFVRDMGPVARTSGLRVNKAQIVAFAMGAAIMAIAGSLLSSNGPSGFISITSFDPSIALTVLLMVLLGGIGVVWGPIIGAILLTYLPQVLQHWPGLNYEDLVYALAVLFIILVLPGGLTSLPAEFRMRRSRLKTRMARS
jgi:ABC-type branched-subunit amino acid transport system permease subunit